MTAQISDLLKFEDRWFSLACEPLGDWLDRRKNRKMQFKRMHSACWRGYRASWEITKGRLYMRDFTAVWPDGRKVAAQELFRNYAPQYLERFGANDPANAGPGVFAFWVTGTMRSTFGQLREYEHIGYESRHEGELHLVMRNGFVIGQRIVHRERRASGPDQIDEVFDIESNFIEEDSPLLEASPARLGS